MSSLSVGFFKKPCCKLFGDPKYLPPTVDEFKHLVQAMGWSQKQVALLVGVSVSTVKKWSLSEDSKGHRSIPYSAWSLLLVFAGRKYPESDLNKVLDSAKKC